MDSMLKTLQHVRSKTGYVLKKVKEEVSINENISKTNKTESVIMAKLWSRNVLDNKSNFKKYLHRIWNFCEAAVRKID